MSDYPNIYRAALEIALDSGGINRFRTRDAQEAEFEQWMAQQPQEQLPAIEAWLATLSDEQINLVACGCQDDEEPRALIALAPPFTDDLLTRYFEEVC